MINSLRRGSIAVVGVAESELGLCAPGTTPYDLMAQATYRALSDCGLQLNDIDGIGEVVAESVVAWFADPENQAILQQFKDHFDKNAPLWKVLPEFVAKHPRYERVGLKDICQQIHEFYKSRNVARMTTEMYTSDMVPAMMPSEAWAKMAHKKVDRVPLDQLEDRITAMLVTPYPPGIPLLIPGERFNKRIIDYLYFARDFNERFPGFETDIHGLVKADVDGRSEYYVDCVRQEPDITL